MVLCTLSLCLGLVLGRFALHPDTLDQTLQVARNLRGRVGLAQAGQGYPGHWGVMRPGIGASIGVAALTDDQLTEITRLQSLGYVGGSQPTSKFTGTTINQHGAAPNLRFYLSGHAPGAELINPEGQVQHRWQFSYEQCLAANANGEQSFLADKSGITACWRRARLLPNGDILAIFEGHGLIRLDRDSQLLWSYAGACHHDLDLATDGSIYVLTREAQVVPRFHPSKPILLDFITHLSADGQELGRLDVMQAFANSVYASYLDLAAEAGDIFHTNTLEVLDGHLAHKSPIFKQGNFLISVREIGVVAIIDPTSEQVVWALSGMWRAQHQPTLLANGNLLVFDNQGHAGQSKVVELDPLTQQVIWEYADSPEAPFYSETCGTGQRMANGNTLITESDNGRVFEVTTEGKIVWEFRNPKRTGSEKQYIAAILEMVALPLDYQTTWLTSTDASN